MLANEALCVIMFVVRLCGVMFVVWLLCVLCFDCHVCSSDQQSSCGGAGDPLSLSSLVNRRDVSSVKGCPRDMALIGGFWGDQQSLHIPAPVWTVWLKPGWPRLCVWTLFFIYKPGTRVTFNVGLRGECWCQVHADRPVGSVNNSVLHSSWFSYVLYREDGEESKHTHTHTDEWWVWQLNVTR